MAKKTTTKADRIEDILQYELDSNKPISFKINPLKFKSQKQKDFVDLCKSDDVKLLICEGPAGTGKSLLAIYAALKQVKAGKYERILYVRSPVDSSESGIGFLPGTVYDKTANFMLPLEEKLDKFLDCVDIKQLLAGGIIESTVNTFMRGRSIDNTIVIIDEIQNFHISEIKTVLTRFEENTKIIGLGDKSQSDIGLKSCLNKLLIMFGHEHEQERANENGVHTFRFDIDDVVRSGLTKYIIQVFDKNQKLIRGSDIV